MLEIGTVAPDFKLLDQNGKEHSLSYHKGSLVLIYFYPKDDTPGCTTEACGIRDAYEDFERAGVKVFGVSHDTVESHKKFEEKYKLPFTLAFRSEKRCYQKIRCARRRIYEKDFLSDREGRQNTQSIPESGSDHHGGQILKDIYDLEK